MLIPSSMPHLKGYRFPRVVVTDKLRSCIKPFARQAQRFLAAHDQINAIFNLRRYRLIANSYRHARADAFSLWTDYACK